MCPCLGNQPLKYAEHQTSYGSVVHMAHCPAFPGHDDYMRTAKLSPWTAVDGWRVSLAFHDPMHMVFLGTAKDLVPSAMGYWIRHGYYGDGRMSESLRLLSEELKQECRKQKNFSSKLIRKFSPNNHKICIDWLLYFVWHIYIYNT